MKLILITLVAVVVGMMVACGARQFTDPVEVIGFIQRDSTAKGFDLYNCSKVDSRRWGANSGLGCKAKRQDWSNRLVSVEIYLYDIDADAENECFVSRECKQMRISGSGLYPQFAPSVRFSGNVMLVVFGNAGTSGKTGNIANAILEDLER